METAIAEAQDALNEALQLAINAASNLVGDDLNNYLALMTTLGNDIDSMSIYYAD